MSDRSSDLANVNRRIAEAHTRIERQREILKFTEGGSTHPAAEALLRAMQRTLEQLEEDRRQIEDKAARAKSGRR
jgi:sirohydrochlorin ferrochelatase